MTGARISIRMYLLDTNIVSMLDPRRHEHAPELTEWLDRNGASLFLSVMTITEMDAGVLKLRREGKAERANEIAGLVTAILTDFADRVLPLDIETARHVARLGAATYQQTVACRTSSLPRQPSDTASSSSHATLATLAGSVYLLEIRS